MSNEEMASKRRRKQIMMLMAKAMVLLMVIVGALFIIDKQGSQSELNQRRLNAEAADSTLPLFARVQGGELRAFEVPSSANLHEVYQAIELNVGHVVSLSFDGQRLANDEGTLVADAGMCAESVIDVLPANDLQILDRAIENPNEYLWPCLRKDILNIRCDEETNERIPSEVISALSGVDSYESFEAAAMSLDKGVMEFAAECFHTSRIIELEKGKIVRLETIGLIGDVLGVSAPLSVDFRILNQLTNLSILCMYYETPIRDPEAWCGLSLRKPLKVLELLFSEINADIPRTVVIPDMSQCKELEKILIIIDDERIHPIRLVLDCTQSKLVEAKKIIVVDPRDTEKVDVLWP